MTPTREQVIATPIESYSAEDRAFYAFWYAHMKDDMMQPPLNAVDHSVARLIYSAGRLKGLEEAKSVCIHINAPDGTNAQAWECAAAIEQLKEQTP